MPEQLWRCARLTSLDLSFNSGFRLMADATDAAALFANQPQGCLGRSLSRLGLRRLADHDWLCVELPTLLSIQRLCPAAQIVCHEDVLGSVHALDEQTHHLSEWVHEK